jgi:AraC family transcriptional regulator
MKYVSELFERPALTTSAALAWKGLRVERHRMGAMALPPHYHEQHLLMLYEPTAAPITVRRQQGSKVQKAVIRPGHLGLYPGGEYGPIAWDGPTDNVHVYVDAGHLENLARQDLDLSRFSLRDQFGFADALLSQLGRQLLGAVGTQHTLGLLYVESLTNALCYHLIENHALQERRLGEGRRLTEAVLARIDAYLEAYADQPVTLEILAGLANLSVFHFARRFKRTTGCSPYQYVLAWKVRRARQLLRAGDLPVADISDALGFASPAQFSTAFKRAVGCSPREFQRG